MKQNNKKTTVAGIGIAGLLIIVIQFWSDIYPIICPLISNKLICEVSGKIAEKTLNGLDNITLDQEQDGGQ